MTVVRALLLHALAIAAMAGEATIDPWSTLDPRHQFTCLAKLDAQLAAAPDDQRLLGLAISAYVHLALPAPRLLLGNPGSLLAKADALRERRIKARGGMPHADLAAALPELWLSALHGDTRLAVDGLARHPGAEADPVARALRTFATRDWRGLAAQPKRTPLENYALTWALEACGLGDEGLHGPTGRGMTSPALKAAFALRRNQDWVTESTRAAVAAVGDACWLLGSPSIEDARALELATRFHQLAGWPLPGGIEREALRRRMMASARQPGANIVRTLLAAWWLCDGLARVSATAGSGEHPRLVGLADAARWNRDRLVPLLRTCATHDSRADEPDANEREERRAIADAAGDGLLQHWSALRWGNNDVDPDEPHLHAAQVSADQRQAALAALDQDLVATHGHSAGVHWDMLLQLTTGGAVGELPRRIAARHEPGIIERRRWCAVVACGGSEPDEDFRRRLSEWAARDPWDPDLELWRQLWSPTAARLAFSKPPVAIWIDATVDNTSLPWPRGAGARVDGNLPRELFLIRWEGWIRLPQAGSWRITVASDDGARLTVGDAVVDQWRYQELEVRGVTWEYAAGWHPLRLDYFQGGGEAGCRLLWRPPGAVEDQVVPAEFLAHGAARAPGLVAACWIGSSGFLQPLAGPEQDAWLRERPWLVHAWADRGWLLAALNRWHEAVPWLELPNAGEPAASFSGNSAQRAVLGFCLMMRDPPDSARAIPLLTGHGAARRNSDDGEGPLLLADRAAAIGANAALTAALGAPSCRHLRERFDGSWHVLHGMGALRQGAFALALSNHRWLTSAEKRESLPPALLRLVALQGLMLGRLCGEADGDHDALDTLLASADIDDAPADALARDYLTGRCDAANAITRAAATPQPKAIGYWLGLQALAERRLSEAQAHFATAATGQGTHALSAAALSAWLERLTADQRAALPKRTPIPPRALSTKPGPPAGGADDF